MVQLPKKNHWYLFTIMNSKKQKEILIHEELERRILHGLSCEWDLAITDFKNVYKDKLRKPLFSLKDMNGKWGYWSRKRKEICISRNFVLNHSWDSVCEVLLHEMAHQFSSQVFGADSEPPHGPSFKRACYLLRANPRASGNYKPLDERVLSDSTSREDKIMIRVKKLMSLAQSKNKHEAEAAMAKAYEFIKKYNIDLLASDENRHFISVIVGKPALRHFQEDYHLSSLLQDFYFIYGIWVSTYVLDKGKMGRGLEITCTIQNIKIACYVHDFVRHYIDSQWYKYNKDKALNRYRKTDFAVGIIKGFRSKLTMQNKKKIKDKFAIVKIDDPLLQKYTAYKYPHTTNIRGAATSRDKGVLKDGINVGKELIISKGIAEKGSSKMALIEDSK